MSAATQAEMERLRKERDEAFERGKQVFEELRRVEAERDALAAHVERIRNARSSANPSPDFGIGDWLRSICMAVDETPTTSLARRDLIKQAEGAAMVAESEWSRRHLKPFGNTPQECAANFATLIANDLRQQAEAGK